MLWALHVAHNIDHSDATAAIADMICIAFYFLLRPGEYTGTTADDHPFLLQDITLYLGTQPLNLETAPIAQIMAATFVTYTFTKQKNNNSNEAVSHS